MGDKYLCITIEVLVPEDTKTSLLASAPWTQLVKPFLPESGRVTGLAIEHREHVLDVGGSRDYFDAEEARAWANKASE